MDLQCWIASWVGVAVGVVLTRVWMAFDLDHKLPRLWRSDDEDGPHAQR